MDIETVMFAVIRLDAVTLDAEIVNVFSEKRDALQCMLDCVKNTDVNTWQRKEYDDNQVITVYRLNYFTKKDPLERFFIREFII